MEMKQEAQMMIIGSSDKDEEIGSTDEDENIGSTDEDDTGITYND